MYSCAGMAHLTINVFRDMLRPTLDELECYLHDGAADGDCTALVKGALQPAQLKPTCSSD
jgi:hypothetical protein